MNIDDSYRSLLDVMEEVPVNTRNVLKEESSDFKGFDGEYSPYFPNFICNGFNGFYLDHKIYHCFLLCVTN